MTTIADNKASNNLTFGKKQQNPIEVLNKKASTSLPPEVEGSTFGNVFVEIGNLDWFQYDGQNYLEEGSSTQGKGINNLFANIKFWGDQSKGIYLRFQNAMKKGETVSNKFKYDVKCPEKSFEKYLDDMGILVVDFYDSVRSQTVGTAKIVLKLFIKRQFPITLTGNQNVKIGQFSLSIVSSFPYPQMNSKAQRNKVNLDDSFEENEKLAKQHTEEEKSKRIIEASFPDNRIPSSYQPKKTDSQYKKGEFDKDIDLRPTRESATRQREIQGKENQRNRINIDENEDTLSNQREFEKIFARGEKLKQQMDQALDSGNAWEALHGHHEIPKSYVPPFMNEGQKGKQVYDDNTDFAYEYEIEGVDPKLKQAQEQEDRNQISNQVRPTHQVEGTRHISEMRFIKVKVNTLRIEDEALLHQLIDHTFTVVLELPLPDVYQKKLSTVTIKFSNYDVVSFNEFAFNNQQLYNFKIDEETFTQLTNANLTASIEGLGVKGDVKMLQLIMSKSYKLLASIQLEQTIKIEETKEKPVKKGDKKGTTTQQKKKPQINIAQGQSFTKPVGHIGIELSLQAGDNEEELARDYQIRLKKMEEEKTEQERLRALEREKHLKFSQHQESVLAQLYININSIRNMCLNQDGTFIRQAHDDSFNVRGGLGSGREAINDQLHTDPNQPQIAMAQFPQVRRNLYVQYKGFGSGERYKTGIAFQEVAPHFSYYSQIPLTMSPDTLSKLQQYTLIFEVWDHLSPSEEKLIGLVKIPLESFCISMKTTDTQVFSLNFLADQHCLYPMIIADGYLPICQIGTGLNIGELQVTVALGTALQIDRQRQKDQKAEKELSEMAFKNQMLEMLRQKQEEEQKLRIQLELEKQNNQRQVTSERSRSNTPTRSNNQAVGGGLFDSLLKPGSPGIGEGNPLVKSIGNFLRQSLGVSMGSRDVDIRKMTYLNCLRKLFEEARAIDIYELNGDEIFKDNMKNFDGSIKKEEFFYCLSNKAEFTLTRSEINNIVALMLNISRDDNNNVDIDELQFSYKQYLSYYDSLKVPIVEQFQLFKRNLDKIIDDQTQQEEFIRSIEERATESKIHITDLKEIFEQNGIKMGERQYDILAGYFDLDRNDQIYIPNLCSFLRDQHTETLNFFKVSPTVLTNQINQYIKEQILLDKDYLEKLEEEFKVEIYKAQGRTGSPRNIPYDILANEKINAKLFQFKLRKQGTVISLWEVFCFFEHLNVNLAKMHYEPQRYHSIPFGLLYKFITGCDYEVTLKERKIAIDLAMQGVKASTESVFALAHDLNRKTGEDDGSGIYSDKHEDSEEEVVIQKGQKKGKGRKDKKEMTFVKKQTTPSKSSPRKHEDQSEQLVNRTYKKVKHIFEIKVKELKSIPILDQLIKKVNGNQLAGTTSPSRITAQKQSNKSQYIQNACVKYAFPLDDEEIFQSDYIQLNTQSLEEKNQYDYKVSINTIHNYVMNKDDKIQKLLDQNDHPFNISVTIQDSGREYVIGNAQMPIEDLKELVDEYEKIEDASNEDSESLSRVLYVYGTSYSDRENCYIGKLTLDITYSVERQYLTNNHLSSEPRLANFLGEEEEENQATCFLHKETFVKRKIPLNAVISVSIEKISHLKESIEHIEHFTRIHQQSSLQENKSAKLSSHTGVSRANSATLQRDQAERRRILTNIFKQGLNIVVIGSIFDEDEELLKRFPGSKYTSQILYNTLNPIFNERFDVGIQMDTKIFEYLKNKKAKFEVRHYLISPNKSHSHLTSQSRTHSQPLESDRSVLTEEMDQTIVNENDYIIIGYVTLPLLNLITKNTGLDGDFVIFDEYKQQMGALKLKISLNHHSQNKPLYSGERPKNQILDQDEVNQRTTLIERTMKYTQTLERTGMRSIKGDNQMILGINFVELVFKNRDNLILQSNLSNTLNKPALLYLKFQIRGQSYQTKFLSTTSSKETTFLKALKMNVFDIKRTIMIDLDLLRLTEVEEAFSKPLEIQLWYKKESQFKYQQPEEEKLLGSFFVELNDLGKLRNKRIKEVEGQSPYQAYEGYFSLYDFDKEQVTADRLGCKLFLLRKGNIHLQPYIDQGINTSDAEVLFHNLQPIENSILTQLDPHQKGYADYDDIVALAQRELQDPYLSILTHCLQSLSYKNSDKVYYSPLLGTLPPFFKYMKRFDQFGVIEKFNKEFQALDGNDSGFVSLALFRSVLEHELKIRERIVVDFIQNMRDVDEKQQLQTLDVNILTHSFKSHIDYVVLLRKLAQYFELKNNEMVNDSLSEINQSRILENEVVLRIDIESAVQLKNPFNELEPPNSFVHLRLPFRGCNPGEITTSTIQKSSYPTWNLKGQQIKFQLNQETIRDLIGKHLVFEIYHQQLHGHKDNIQNQLIGVSYVDISQMVFVDGIYEAKGYFHIVDRTKFPDGHLVPLQDPSRLRQESLGQLKLSVVSNQNLRSLAYQNPNNVSIVKENSPVKERPPQMDFGQESFKGTTNFLQFNPYQMSHSRDQTIQGREFTYQTPMMMSQTQQQMLYRFNEVDMDLSQSQDDDLKAKHQKNLSDLDNLISTMKREKLNKQEDITQQRQEEQPVQQPFDYQTSYAFGLTVGHGQSVNLQTQLMGTHQNLAITNPFQQQFMGSLGGVGAGVVQELEQEQSEFDRENDQQAEDDREDNIFNQNISRLSRQSQDVEEEKKLPEFEETPVRDSHQPTTNMIPPRNIFEEDSQQQEPDFGIRQPQPATRKVERSSLMDEVLDPAEYKRLEKILRSQKK